MLRSCCDPNGRQHTYEMNRQAFNLGYESEACESWKHLTLNQHLTYEPSDEVVADRPHNLPTTSH